MSVGLHQLRYFVAVAEEGNVSRAAARLHIAQPSLSAQIKQLETILGVPLLRRHPRGVELTRAGALFLEEARAAVRAADAAVAVARMAARGEAGTLRIGLIVGTYAEAASSIVKAFRDRYPRVKIEFAEHTYAQPSGGLNERTVDVAFVMPPFAHEGLSFLEIDREPRVAVVPEDHPAARRDAVPVRELFGDRWIVADTPDAVCRDFWLAMDHRDGVPPRLGPVTQTMDKFIRHVMAGEVVGLAEASVEQAFARPGIRFVPVVDIEPVTTVLGWRPGSPNPLVERFVAVARDELAR